jgi:lysozyme
MRKGVLLNMSFQLGVEGLLKFERALGLIEVGPYDLAAHAMLQSKWAKQTPARAMRMAEQMRGGQWQYAPGT